MTAQRILLIWGIIWLLIWMVFGIIVGSQVIPTRIEKESSYVKALEKLSAGKLKEAEIELRKGLKLEAHSMHKASAHGHALCYAFLVLIIGLIMPFSGIPEKMKNITGLALIAGTFLHPIGILTELVNEKAGMVIIIVGAPLIILGAAFFLWGLIEYAWKPTHS